MADADDPLPSLVMDVLTLDREVGRLSGPTGSLDLRRPLVAILERLMQRPGAFLAEDKLLAAVFGDDVPEDGAAVLKWYMRDLTGATRLLSQSRVRIREEPAAGYVLEMRSATTEEGRAMLPARAGRSRGRPRQG